MPTAILEGQGVTISFATSNFTANVISLTLPDRSRETIEDTHLGTSTAKTFKPAALIATGDVTCEFEHQPEAVDLLKQSPETITITYPLQSGQTTPTRKTFNGFATNMGGEEFKTDSRMTTKVTLKVNGDITTVAAT